MSTNVAMLADVPLFQLIDDQERATLAELMSMRSFERGETIFEEGQPGESLYLVHDGRVQVFCHSDSGEKIILAENEKGDVFGEISLLDGGSRTARAAVKKSGEMIVVDRGDLDELLRIKPAAALNLLTATGKRLRTNAAVLRNTAAKNSYEAAEEQLNVIQEAADWVANFSGSLSFLIIHIIGFTIYILLNVGLFSFGNFDAFPFGLLTMAVSLEAIILSTLLLYSSNRQAARDRVRADIEYDVNLKAELQIQHLHEKIDQIHAQILGRLDALDPKRRPHGALPHDLSG